MDLLVIEALAGGVVFGAALAAGVCAIFWGRRLKTGTQRIARLEQARQQAEQRAAKFAGQNEQMQREIAELRHQAERERERAKRQAALKPAPAAEAEDLLFRNSRPPPLSDAELAAAEQFPATMILPRKPPA